MNLTLLLAGVLALVGAFGGGYWRGGSDREAHIVAEHERQQITVLSDAIKEQSDRAIKQKADQDRTAGIVAANRKMQDQLRAENLNYEAKIADLTKDPVARQWLDAAVPRGIWCGLRQQPAGIDCGAGGKGTPPAGPDGGNAIPKTVDGDRLRLAVVLAAPGGGAGQLQRGQSVVAGVGD